MGICYLMKQAVISIVFLLFAIEASADLMPRQKPLQDTGQFLEWLESKEDKEKAVALWNFGQIYTASVNGLWVGMHLDQLGFPELSKIPYSDSCNYLLDEAGDLKSLLGEFKLWLMENKDYRDNLISNSVLSYVASRCFKSIREASTDTSINENAP